MGTYPDNDSFDANTAAPDTTYLTGNYIKFQPFSSGSIVVDATTFWPANRFASGVNMNLHNGWFNTQGTGTATTYVTGGRATATLSGQVDAGSVARTSSLAGFMFRDYMAADVELNGSFRFSGVPSAPTRAYGFGFALAARLRGTQVSGGATGTTHGSITGYYFGLFGEHANGATGGGTTARLRWLMVKMSGGVATVVASATPSGAVADFLYPLVGGVRTNPDRLMRFTVQTVGATVVLTGYSVDSAGTATQVLTYTDSTSPITNTGRAGIVMSVENSQVGATVTGVGDIEHQNNWWSVKPIGGNVVLREEWERFHSKGGLLVTVPNVTFPHSLTKHSLLSGWFGDYFCVVNAAGAFSNSLRVDSANNRIKLVPSANSTRVFAFSERIANDPQFQDRQVDIVFENAGPAVAREAGIQCYGSLGSTDYTVSLSTIQKCYMLTVEYTATGTFNLVLYRSRGLSAPIQIVKKTGLAGLALGTSFTLRFYVDTLTVPTPKDGYVRMAAFINGVQQTWDKAPGYYNDAGTSIPSNGAVAYQVQASGAVIDRKSTRISSGLGQGVHASSATVATANVFFDAWTAGVGDAPQEPGEDNQASVVVPAENDTASGTFTVPYDWSADQSDAWAVRDHRFDSDHRFVAVAQGRPRGRWNLGCNAATSSEVATLKSFFDSHKGIEIPFTWTTPKGDSKTVRFTNDRLVVEQVTPDVFSWSATFEEVLAE